jgi:putative membrane protein
MPMVAAVLVGFVALQHVGFFVLESFLWKGPIGRKVFRLDAQRAEVTAALAANQGVYNAFLAAGLLWSFFAAPGLAFPLRYFFLGCVIVAGLAGAATVNRRIFFVQAVPAIAALVAVLAARGE